MAIKNPNHITLDQEMSQNKLEKFIDRINNGEIIKQVDVSGSGLKVFPNELFLAKQTLELINLGGNSLSSLPANMSEFTKLKILFFANNAFEEIPACLGQLQSLYMLSFKSNRIRFVSEEALCPTIGWLILTDNLIYELPEGLGNKLPNMKKLMLAANKLHRLPESLQECRELELLRLAGNNLKVLPSWLFTLPKLSWLALAGNPLINNIETNPPRLIDWNELVVGEKVGEGASGLVYRGTWDETSDGGVRRHDVAVKLFKGEATSDGYPVDEMKATEAAGDHINKGRLFGRLVNEPSGKQGLVFSFTPTELYSLLGGPPSFETVTRDVYREDQIYSIDFVVRIITGVASLGAHLHGLRISHGDLYAHNILQTNGFPLLGDFGAATMYNGIAEKIVPSGLTCADYYLAIQGLEVRAFGCLLEDMLWLVPLNQRDEYIYNELEKFKELCFNVVPERRPTFLDIEVFLSKLIN